MANGQGLSVKEYPPVCGDFQIKIDKNGQWYYQNSPIGRIKLSQLFAVCLLREGEEYFLATPAEKGRIEVEDVPFIGVEAEVAENMIEIRTNLDFWVRVGPNNPIIVLLENQQPKPLCLVRDNLWMRLNRNVFYYLVERAQLLGDEYYCQSGGAKFFLGFAEPPADIAPLIKKIQYRALHRGTVECDLILQKYIIPHLPSMSRGELHLLGEFLQCDEQIVHSALVKKIPTPPFDNLLLRLFL